MVKINPTTAKQTSKRIRGMTQKRLQEFNLLRAALSKVNKGRVTLHELCMALREDLGSLGLATGK